MAVRTEQETSNSSHFGNVKRMVRLHDFVRQRSHVRVREIALSFLHVDRKVLQ
jgi:hypothetical protein